MVDYRKFVPFVLRWEGGLSNDPDDSGGLTNMGITFNTYKQLSERVLGEKPTEEKFRTLSKNDAALFVKYFWDKATNNNSINSQAIAEAITSWFWGSGVYGLKNWQSMLNHRFNKNLKVDGIIGPLSVSATNSISEKKLLQNAIDYRANYFKQLTERRPKDKKFLNGWLNRLNDFAKRHSNVLAAGGGLLSAFFLASLYI